MRTLLALPFINISLHEAPVLVLELQWLSYAASADFRPAALQALTFSQQHRVQAWVADDRHLGAVRPRDLEWAEQAILAPLDELGLQRFAKLESQDPLNRLTLNTMYTRMQPALRFEIRNFNDLVQARTWASGGA